MSLHVHIGTPSYATQIHVILPFLFFYIHVLTLDEGVNEEAALIICIDEIQNLDGNPNGMLC